MRYDPADTAYQALIAELSPELPYHGLEPRDVRLSPDDLAIVMEAHGGAAHFVADALNDPRDDGSDAIDSLAARVLMQRIDEAATACGLCVLNAVHRYAERIVCRDVEQYRRLEREDSEPEFWGDVADRERDATPMFLKPQAL